MPFRPTHRRTRRAGTVALTGLAAAAVALAGCSNGPNDRKDTSSTANPTSAASGSAGGAATVIASFAKAWMADWNPGGTTAVAAKAAALTTAPTTFGPILDGVDNSIVVQTVTVAPQGSPACSAATACTQQAAVTAQLRGLGTVKWTSTIPAVSTGGAWKVKADPGLIYPGLSSTTMLTRERYLPNRASILDRNGKALTSVTGVVHVGVNPARANAATYAAFQTYLDVDAANLKKKAQAAAKGQMVDVITVRASQWNSVKAKFDPVPGIVALTGSESLPPSPSFARAVLGQLSEASAELRTHAGITADSADMVGSSGLQYAFQQQLAGTPGGVVALRDKSTRRLIKTVFQGYQKNGTPLRTSLDKTFQQAAENAVATSKLPVHMVAIQASTGQILAVANGPGTQNYNAAFLGQYAPGSTFKVVTSTALIQHGLNPNSQLACTPKYTVGGYSFGNEDGLTAYGSGTMTKAMQVSCNTAFISAGMKLPDTSIRTAAALYGFNAKLPLSIAATGGSAPVPAAPVDNAASMIGQGKVTASPLQMATVAAAVANGTSRKPVLVPGKDPSGPIATLPGNVAADERTMLRATVSSASGTAHVLSPAGAVGAKTGTAQVVVDGKTITNGWMIGYRGDVAFAAIVEGGESGLGSAGPVLLKFLKATG